MGWRAAECHPEEKHCAKGLCYQCYQRFKRNRRSELLGISLCHPPKKEYANKQCQSCYDKEKRNRQATEGLIAPPRRERKFKCNSDLHKDQNCVECYNLNARFWRKLGRYGLSEEAYLELLMRQQNKCAICYSIIPRTKGALSFDIDHDHSCCDGPKSCGKCVRGLLCGNCNKMLGLAQDSSTILYRALNYLETYNKLKGLVR